MRISSTFDGGNLEVVAATDPANLQLRIRADHQSDFYQWFYGRVATEHRGPHTLKLLNAGGAAYAQGWEGYQALVSTDAEHWQRTPTQYRDGVLEIEVDAQTPVFYLAYFAPYSYERHQRLVHWAAAQPQCRLEDLGATLDGRDMSLLVVGDEAQAKFKLWMIARQHPGETMAEWLMEGLLQRLLDPSDPTAREILAQAVCYVVPNMNPDGSVRGHLRTNAAGVNLNREWQSPSLERSPEVYVVREKMQHTGVDFMLDVHGDETLPYNFLVDTHGVPSYNERIRALNDRFAAAFLAASPDFQTQHGYPKNPPGRANLTLAATWVGETFDCVSYTLEMPFKDNAERPDPVVGWSPERSQRLGRDVLAALRAIVADLRNP